MLLVALLHAACVPLLDDSCGPAVRETVVRGDIRGVTSTSLGMAEMRHERPLDEWIVPR